MDKIKEMLKNKKVLTGAAAGLAVVVILIIVIAVSCNKNDDTGKGTSKTTTKADITTVKKAEKDTADEQNTTEPDTEMSENETSTAEDSTEEVSEEETTEQPTVEQPTTIYVESKTEAPTPQPIQAPTEAPTTTQEQTTVPAGYSPTAKFPYDETVKELHDTYGYPYPTVDYSTLPVQDFSQYFFDPEATGVQNNYFGENSKYITRIIYNPDSVTTYQFDLYNPEEDNFLITFPKEIPLYTLVNWNGKIGFFSNGSNREAENKLMTTDFHYPCKEYVEGYGEMDVIGGSHQCIQFGTNLTWDDCPDGLYLFIYIKEPK